MRKKAKVLFVTLLVVILAAIIGCSTVQDAVTPCYIDKDCGTYADSEMTMFTPYTSLFDAKRISARMAYINAVGELQYAFLNDSLNDHMAKSESFKQTVFDPTGPLGGLLIGLPTFGLGAMLVSKPEDKKKIIELEKANGNSGKA